MAGFEVSTDRFTSNAYDLVIDVDSTGQPGTTTAA